jgi:FkbM family methyltransferase
MSFFSDYVSVVINAIEADFEDNFDIARFGDKPKNLGRKTLDRILAKLGFFSRGETRQVVQSALMFAEPYMNELEWIHSKLSDSESRYLLVQLTAFRALGHRKIKLPTNCPEHWKWIETAEKLFVGGEQIESGFMGWKLTKADLSSIGYPIKLFFTPFGVVIAYIEQQYRCVTSNGSIACTAGDYVIDAGGCWGDTALYFAHLAGPDGRVASFEFLPSNVEIFKKNLSLNPDLSRRIHLHPNAVWSRSGEKLEVTECGPGTSVAPGTSTESQTTNPKGSSVETKCIDDLVKPDFDRVDFIKMDIEGSELEALHGAEAVLKKFKPKLAITVYHNFEDYWTIPQYIESLGLGYRFYLRHFTMHAEETVLFARVE